MDDYEAVLLVKQEVFVYKIPPRATNRGYRASDWKLDSPDWTGKLHVVAKGKKCSIKLLDKTTGDLFAQGPIDKFPGTAFEAVSDSSRYFVLRIESDDGQSAFIGIGFADRGDSFDLNVALQDHFKWLETSEEIETRKDDDKPALDLGFKEGQTITINMNIANKKSGSARPRAKPGSAGSGGSIPGLLPPPPTSANTRFPNLQKIENPIEATPPQVPSVPVSPIAASGGELLFDIGANVASKESPQPSSIAAACASDDAWSDFASARSASSSLETTNQSETKNWMDF